VSAGLRLGERQTSDVTGDVTGETIPADPLDTSGTDIEPTTGTGTDPSDTGTAGDTGPTQRAEQAQEGIGAGVSGAAVGVGLGETPADVLDTSGAAFGALDADPLGRQALDTETGARTANDVLAGVQAEQQQQFGQRQRLEQQQRLDQRQRVEAAGRPRTDTRTRLEGTTARSQTPRDPDTPLVANEEEEEEEEEENVLQFETDAEDAIFGSGIASGETLSERIFSDGSGR
jgi:hypothetical protein